MAEVLNDQIKKRHHYVQKAYLDAWKNSDEHVWQLIKPNHYSYSKTINVMVSNHYNTIEATNENERLLILSFLDEESSNFVSRLPLENSVDVLLTNEIYSDIEKTRDGFLNTLDYIIWSSRFLEFYGKNPDFLKNEPQIELVVKTMRTSFVEGFMCDVESVGFPVIRKLIKGAPSLTKEEKESVLKYCAISFARTYDSGSKIIKIRSKYVDIKKIRPILQVVLGYTVWRKLITKKCSIRLICNKSQKRFITGSQPCIMLSGHLNRRNRGLCFYMPISPYHALVVGEKRDNSFGITSPTEKEIRKYNKKIYKASSSLVAFAKEDLEALTKPRYVVCKLRKPKPKTKVIRHLDE